MNKIVPFRSSEPGLVTEDAAALEFVGRFENRLRFDHSAGAWFYFDGARWAKDGTRRALEWAREIGRELSIGARDDRTRAVIGRAGFAKGVETLARVDRRIAVESSAWDRDPFLLGTPDGTIDLQTGQLLEPNPADMISKVTAVGPAATAHCPTFLAFLTDAVGHDVAVLAFLRRWFGYCLTGDVCEHAMLFIVGEGGNGKSVLLNTMRGLLGCYSVNAAMDSFVASYGEKHPADMAALQGARLVTASETEYGRTWDEVRLKTLTGGDPVTARHMRQNFFTFSPTFKLLFAGNAKPDLRSVNAAMRRRVNVVEFNHKPPAPDLQLEEKLREEWPAILRWAIDGCVEWQAAGLRRPAAVVAASDAYFREQDVFGRWIDDECVVELHNEITRTPAKDLWESWRRYAEQNHKPPGRMNDFSEALLKRGATKYWTRQGRGYAGISLREEAP